MIDRDNIVRMAREAGFNWPDIQTTTIEERLERFASLVAAAERERIAQMVEEAPPLMAGVQNNEGGCLICGFTPKLAAAAIRARSNT